MYNTYRINKERAIFTNTEESKTDQSQANDTDINVIVKRYGVTGTVPGAKQPAMYGDFSELPRDLREVIESGKQMQILRKSLPEQLREIPLDELLNLTPTEINNLMAPPADPPVTPKE